MTLRYEEAVERLYRAPLEEFVSERKRLASELTAAGDKDGSKRLAKLTRPTVSAWAVNQLWWRERPLFDKLLATGQRLASGDLAVMRAHREIVSELRELATRIIADSGHGTADAVLRRVTTTLHAIAASGGFEPDPPGALAGDRDPPGFETMAPFAANAPAAPPKAREASEARGSDEDARTKKQRLAEEAAQKRAEARRLAEEKARKLAERRQLEGQLAALKRDIHAEARELERLRGELAEREAKLDEARGRAEALEAQLAKLG